MSRATTAAPSPFRPANRHRVERAVAILAFACGAISGCPPPQPARPPTPPRDSAEIVSLINDNNRRIDRPLYSPAVRVAAHFRDERGRPHDFNFDGTLLVRKPRELRLDLRHPLGEPVMGVGSNDDDFWAWVKPELSTFWWGRHRHVGKTCADPIPLRPEQLLETLGIHVLPTGDAELVGPARMYGNEFDRLLYLRRDEDGRFRLDREYWIERRPPHLVRVILFRDAYGRRAVNAWLGDYRPAWDGGPLVAHEVSVFWPEDDGRLSMSVSRFTVPSRISPRAFARPEASALGLTRQRQVDETCDTIERVESISASAPATQAATQPESGD